MDPRTTPFEYVFASAARRDALATLARNPLDRRTVVDRLEASESAVYDAFAGLAERGLIVREGNRWRVTGTGRAVADCLDRCRRVDETLLEAPTFWQSHDLDGLAPTVRTALLQASDRSVKTAQGEWTPGKLLAAHVDETVSETVTAVVGEDVGRPLLDRLARLEDARVVCARSVLEAGRALGDGGVRSADGEDRASVRLRACESTPAGSLLVTDEDVAVALPPLRERLGGGGVVTTEDDRVRRRARAHVDRLWERGSPYSDPTSAVQRS